MARTALIVYDIRSLCRLFETGKVVIPSFQRGFVWRKSQVLELMASIYNGYPIGTIIMFEEPDRSSASGERIWSVLDGAQRLLTLQKVFFARESDIHVGFDLKTETFISQPKTGQRNVIDLHALYSRDGLLRYQRQAMSSKTSDKLLAKINALYEAFTGYQIPVQVISEISAEDAASIFLSVNTMGAHLSRSELQRAVGATKRKKLRNP